MDAAIQINKDIGKMALYLDIQKAFDTVDHNKLLIS